VDHRIETYYDVGGWLGLTKWVNMPWIPLSFFLMLTVFASFQVLLLTTRFGRDIYAVGGNEEAARLAGIRTNLVIMAAYSLAGFAAAITALIMVARFTTSTEALGTGMELTTIAAAVIGGVSPPEVPARCSDPNRCIPDAAILLGLTRSASASSCSKSLRA
jgi:ribose/xylose/arabinose/galactoside ABC-type transport system permease subunit